MHPKPNIQKAKNRSTLFVALLLIASLPSGAYTQAIGHTTLTFVDESRNNRQIPTEVYYPSAIAGTNSPIAAGQFPLIVFGHGFLMTWMAYENIWTSLVSQGYIVAFPTTESGFAPSHSDFGLDLKFLDAKIKSSGAGLLIPASSLTNTSAIMGHSMGGGSAFLATANNGSVTTLITFAAANTTPSSIAAAQQVSVPTLIISATNDCITPPPQQQDIMYDSSRANLKTQVYIKGGSHCYFANDNLYCSIGESTCSPKPTITREEQHNTTASFVIQWLNYFLKAHCEQADAFQDSLYNSSKINFRQSQSIACTPSGMKNNNDQNILSIYPNPNNGAFTIKSSFEINHIVITDCKGRVAMLIDKPDRMVSLNLSHEPSGIYLIKITGMNGESLIEKLFLHK
jgi:dienelactone hydrolase